MPLDNAKNFAKVTVSTGYDASATSIALTAGHGTKLPTAPFNVVWWNSTDYPDPSDDPNVEIVRVTNISTDTLTVTRAQESTSASTKNTGGKTYKMIAGLTAKAVNSDIAQLNASGALLIGDATLSNSVLDFGLGGASAKEIKMHDRTIGSVATVLSNGFNEFVVGRADAAVRINATHLVAPTAKLTPIAFASLPASPAEGWMAWVNDSNTATWGATAAGGGANKVLVVYNGTNWTVAGK